MNVGHGSVHASGAAVSDWRYWITRSGVVRADDEVQAMAMASMALPEQDDVQQDIEVERLREVGEGE